MYLKLFSMHFVCIPKQTVDSSHGTLISFYNCVPDLRLNIWLGKPWKLNQDVLNCAVT